MVLLNVELSLLPSFPPSLPMCLLQGLQELESDPFLLHRRQERAGVEPEGRKGEREGGREGETEGRLVRRMVLGVLRLEGGREGRRVERKREEWREGGREGEKIPVVEV